MALQFTKQTQNSVVLMKTLGHIFLLTLFSFFCLSPFSAQAEEDFSIVLIPDTQLMIQNYPGIVDTMLQWIATESADSNIVFTLGLGDMVQSALDCTQWVLNDSFYQVLDDSALGYAVVEGNHDLSGDYFDQFFGVSRFSSKPSWGGYYSGPASREPQRSTYHFFEAGSNKFIVFALNYESDSTYYPYQYAWIDSLMKLYSSRTAIVVRHWMLNADNSWVADSTIIDSLKDNPNFDWMFCGHRYAGGDGAAYRTVLADDGDSIRIIMADYQFFPYGGEGWMRFLKFSPTADSVYMTTYSPWLDSTMTTYPDQKTFYYDLNNEVPPPPPSHGRSNRVGEPGDSLLQTIVVLDSDSGIIYSGPGKLYNKHGTAFLQNTVHGLPGQGFLDWSLGTLYERNELSWAAYRGNVSVSFTNGGGFTNTDSVKNRLFDGTGNDVLFYSLTDSSKITLTVQLPDPVVNEGYQYWMPFAHFTRDSSSSYTTCDSIAFYVSSDGSTWYTPADDSWSEDSLRSKAPKGFWQPENPGHPTGPPSQRWSYCKIVLTDFTIGTTYNYFNVQELGLRHPNTPTTRAYSDPNFWYKIAIMDTTYSLMLTAGYKDTLVFLAGPMINISNAGNAIVISPDITSEGLATNAQVSDSISSLQPTWTLAIDSDGVPGSIPMADVSTLTFKDDLTTEVTLTGTTSNPIITTTVDTDRMATKDCVSDSLAAFALDTITVTQYHELFDGFTTGGPINNSSGADWYTVESTADASLYLRTPQANTGSLFQFSYMGTLLLPQDYAPIDTLRLTIRGYTYSLLGSPTRNSVETIAYEPDNDNRGITNICYTDSITFATGTSLGTLSDYEIKIDGSGLQAGDRIRFHLKHRLQGTPSSLYGLLYGIKYQYRRYLRK